MTEEQQLAPHAPEQGFKNTEASSSSRCGLCFQSLTIRTPLLSRSSHQNVPRQSVTGLMSCDMSQALLWLMRENWMWNLNVHVGPLSVCVCVCVSVCARVCTLPCGHVVSSVACGWEEKRCEGKLNVWTCQDLSLRSLRCVVHTPSGACEGCHLSAAQSLLSSTDKTHTHTYTCTQTHTRAITAQTNNKQNSFQLVLGGTGVFPFVRLLQWPGSDPSGDSHWTSAHWQQRDQGASGRSTRVFLFLTSTRLHR